VLKAQILAPERTSFSLTLFSLTSFSLTAAEEEGAWDTLSAASQIEEEEA